MPLSKKKIAGLEDIKKVRPRLRKNLHQIIGATIVVADQIADFIVFTSLLLFKEFWFALIYLAVDVLPAAIIMWHQFQEERSWKVLV